jgi:hypothetical protein
MHSDTWDDHSIFSKMTKEFVFYPLSKSKRLNNTLQISIAVSSPRWPKIHSTFLNALEGLLCSYCHRG